MALGSVLWLIAILRIPASFSPGLADLLPIYPILSLCYHFNFLIISPIFGLYWLIIAILVFNYLLLLKTLYSLFCCCSSWEMGPNWSSSFFSQKVVAVGSWPIVYLAFGQMLVSGCYRPGKKVGSRSTIFVLLQESYKDELAKRK